MLLRRTTSAPPVAAPHDVEALEEVLAALDGDVRDELGAHRAIVDTLTTTLGLAYGAVWTPVGEGRFRLRAQSGEMTATLEATGVSVITLNADQLRWATAQTLAVLDQASTSVVPTHQRWRAAAVAGAAQGAILPIVVGGRLVGLHEYYGRSPLPFFGHREAKWKAISRIAARELEKLGAVAGLREALDDRSAVTDIIAGIGAATTVDSALRTALDSVRSTFGWAYGSFWRLDESDRTLKFQLESGSAGQEFREVTLRASFAEGVGLSGRAWRARDLVFVPDLGEVRDCVRAPAAQRAGVRSGVCFPLLEDGRVVGTMDFFTTDTIELSASRAAALRNVAQLVSQRLTMLGRSEQDALAARDLLQTVVRLRQAAQDSGSVADAAREQAGAMTADVQSLQRATTSISEVIEIITKIAGQTNLLALNATIEAARAGDTGRGFAVVAQEVKELARETAVATQRVGQQISDIQASSRSVSGGIEETARIVGELDAVQSGIEAVLDEQQQMAAAFER